MHICVSQLINIGSDNSLSPDWRQAIIWNNDGILLNWTLGTNFSETLSKIDTFSFKQMRLKMSSGKWQPYCLGLNVLSLCNFDSLAPGGWGSKLKSVVFEHMLRILSSWTLPVKSFWGECPRVLLVIRPFPEPILIQIYVAIWCNKTTMSCYKYYINYKLIKSHSPMMCQHGLRIVVYGFSELKMKSTLI